MAQTSATSEWFDGFVTAAEPKLRRAFVAALGQQAGLDATSIALSYAWEHRDRLREMQNPAGYVYRVGRSRVGRRRREPHFLPVPADAEHDLEPGLPDALAKLTEKQRAAVMMVHAAGWTRHEAADALDIGLSSLDTHLARGLRRLRHELGVHTHG
ncbi:MAG: hypothetical protein HKN44_11505 [Ilumatobacter sp.]|nr:hypothetical protein [Ilumatobacter sp.]